MTEDREAQLARLEEIETQIELLRQERRKIETELRTSEHVDLTQFAEP